MTARRGGERGRPRARQRHGGGGRAVQGRKGLVLFGMALLVMLVAGGAFFYKMTEFVLTMPRGDVAGFGVVSVATYLLGMIPLMCLTVWAALTGRFRDVERPKVRMLELDELIERGGDLGASPGSGTAAAAHYPDGLPGGGGSGGR